MALEPRLHQEGGGCGGAGSLLVAHCVSPYGKDAVFLNVSLKSLSYLASLFEKNPL